MTGHTAPNPGDPVPAEIEDLPSRSGAPTAGTIPASSPAVGVASRPVRYGDGAVIACDGLVRIYKQADLEVVALQGLDLLVEGGEMIAIVGASGSGKSTLLNILGGHGRPVGGPRGRRRLRPAAD